ncbi:hypothetical protein [Cellulomonas sp. 73-145]|uniref:SHOCT domain-containing protein n=1 Tax=Cellulomonas sp. 73-145 TaxID=1895739 RepID=UPI0025BF56E0|nr:hypothetical protein [Cellulomonas sp. 73-145]
MLDERTPVGVPSSEAHREAGMPTWCSTSSGVGWFVMVAAWALLVGLAIWAVCRLFPAQARPDARTVLEERLASGELDVEQYRELRDALDDRSATGGTR